MGMGIEGDRKIWAGGIQGDSKIKRWGIAIPAAITNADLTESLRGMPVLRAANARNDLTTSSRAVLEQCSTLLGENTLLLRKNEEIKRDNKRLKVQSPCHDDSPLTQHR